jgi:type I restriction enzyme S subunit
MIITDKTKKPESTWIEEVPFHWKESKNKYVFKLRKAVVGEDWKKYTLLSLSKRGVVPRDIESGKGKFPESFDTYQVVMESDLVFCLYDVEETPRAVGFSEIEGMITGSYDVLEVIDGEPKFFYYYYLTIDDFKGFKPLYTGMRNVVRPENFNNLKIYLPPLHEQQQIVTYLDHKTTLIDQIISGSEKKTELLKEQRTAIINHAVTKGLNPKVKMKDSGVAWIGEIPEGWDVKKMKYCVRLISEKGETTLGDIKISPENVENETGVCFNFYSDYEGEGMKFRNGDILLNKLRIYLKKIVLTDFDGFSMGEMIVLRTFDGLSKYYHYMLFNQGLIDLLNEQSTGVKLPRVSPDIILNTSIVYPTLSEQQQIVTYLDQKTKEIDDLVIFEKKRIELMKEYRQSLISEVVTGKMNVTND